VTVPGQRTDIDPVCGMTVDLEEARADGRTIEHNGRTYGFCSKGCLREFRESPEPTNDRVK
jgi:YHS domain-containing protein